MLVLTRKLGETLVIDGRIKISIVAVRQRQVRVSIDAPKEVRILRGELAPLPNAADPAPAAAHTSDAVRPPVAAHTSVAASADEPLTTDSLDSSTLDSSLFATADAMVCESFGMCHALGQDRYRWDANGNSEMGAETAMETETEMVIATEMEMEMESEADTDALGSVAKTAVPTARPARPRRSLGLRGFRNARRNHAMAGHSNAGSSNAVAARAATEQPAPASDVAHSVRATAG